MTRFRGSNGLTDRLRFSMETEQGNHISRQVRLRRLASLAVAVCCVVALVVWLESRQAVVAVLIAVAVTAWLWAASKAPGATGVLSLAVVLGVSLIAMLTTGIYRTRQRSLSDTVMDRQQQIGRALHEREDYSKHQTGDPSDNHQTQSTSRAR